MPTLTVAFDGTYWIGLIEAEEHNGWHAYRHIFGGEPGGPEVHLFVLYELMNVISRPGAAIPGGPPAERPKNPKRAARIASRSTAETGLPPKIRDALREERQAAQRERRAQEREERRQQDAEARVRRSAKAKEKKRGH